MRRVFVLFGFALVLSWALWDANAAIWYQQNFDKLNDGDMAGQDGWEKIIDMTADIGSPTVQSAVFHGKSGKALKAEAKQEIMKSFTPVHTGTQFLIIYFRKEDTGADNTLHIYMGKEVHEWAAGPVLRIGSQSGDPTQVGAHNAGTIEKVGTIVPKQWHEVRVVVNYANLTYDAYFDGKQVATGFKFRKDVHDALGWLMLGFDAGVGVLGYYDDIIMGDGTGADATAVDSEAKLATTWGGLKL